MNIKKISFVVLCLLLFLPNGGALAGSFTYNTVFNDGMSYWETSWVQLKTPARTTDGKSNVFSSINAKNMQPRSGGSTPHKGLDLNMVYPASVYSPYSGTVSNVGTYSISVQIFTNTHAGYVHVVPLVSNETAVTADEPIARIGRKSENGGYPEHLHYEISNDKNRSISQPIGPRYKSYAGWDYGNDPDWISQPYFNSTTKNLFLTAFVWNDTRVQSQKEVKIWYHKGDNVWKSANMKVDSYKKCPVTGKNHPKRWSFDFTSIANSGDIIYYYVAGYREINDPDYDTYDQVAEPHNWSIFPAKYSHPTDNGNNYPSTSPPTHILRGF